MIVTVVAFGFLLGIRHALEADHIAAVASLATRARSTREIVRVSAAWGFGHALTLVLFGSMVIALGVTLSDRVSRALELAVGLTLVLLGADVLRRLRGRRVHIHSHRHDDGTTHWHVHAHRRDGAPVAPHPARHEHFHLPVTRALLVGGVHGLAGSAALVLVSAQATDSIAAAISYLAAFGVGSVIGMVAFSVAISLPIARASGSFLEKNWPRMEAVLGCVTIAIGAWVMLRAGGL